MEPDDQTWQIIANNDDRLDGQQWYAVKSTKIFCKPSCPSRLPDRQNVIMYADPEQAMADGFRPCKRCRPLDTIVPNHVWVTEIDYVLNQHYAETMTLDELAARVHGSKSHLRHVYKAKTGITPQQKLMAIRLSHAEHQLTNSNHSVAQIGRAVGIPNTAYFIKLFKKHYGVSPLQYRLTN